MKNSNELEFLLNTIQSRTKQSLSQIATNIGITKEHLIRSKNNATINSSKTIGLIKENYAEILKDRILDTDKVKYFEAAFEVVFSELAALRAAANRSVAQEENLKLQESVQNILRLRRSLSIPGK